MGNRYLRSAAETAGSTGDELDEAFARIEAEARRSTEYTRGLIESGQMSWNQAMQLGVLATERAAVEADGTMQEAEGLRSGKIVDAG
jgi:hypothetical protein